MLIVSGGAGEAGAAAGEQLPQAAGSPAAPSTGQRLWAPLRVLKVVQHGTVPGSTVSRQRHTASRTPAVRICLCSRQQLQRPPRIKAISLRRGVPRRLGALQRSAHSPSTSNARATAAQNGVPGVARAPARGRLLAGLPLLNTRLWWRPALQRGKAERQGLWVQERRAGWREAGGSLLPGPSSRPAQLGSEGLSKHSCCQVKHAVAAVGAARCGGVRRTGPMLHQHAKPGSSMDWRLLLSQAAQLHVQPPASLSRGQRPASWLCSHGTSAGLEAPAAAVGLVRPAGATEHTEDEAQVRRTQNQAAVAVPHTHVAALPAGPAPLVLSSWRLRTHAS